MKAIIKWIRDIRAKRIEREWREFQEFHINVVALANKKEKRCGCCGKPI